MKDVLLRYFCALLFVMTTSTCVAETSCSRDTCMSFSRDAVQEIVSTLQVKDSDVVVVIDDDISLAQELNESVDVRELIVVIHDSEACERLEKDLHGSAKNVRIVCGGFGSVDISAATVIIIPSINVTSDDILANILRLPDGVKVLTRQQLAHHESVHLEAIRSIALSAVSHVLMYEYVVKRPTVADLLTTMYRGMTGFGISQEEADVVRKAGGDPTYGEIEFSSAEKIFTELVPLTERDVFYDLGCGIGKLATWVYLATPAKKVVAIELADTRFKVAIEAQRLMKTTILPARKAIMRADWGERADRKILEIVQGDIADADLRDATVIYMCATCYPDALMQKMADKFVTLKEGLRIVTLKELPENPSLHRVGTPQRFKMTWSPEKGSPVYIYEMRHPSLKDVLTKAYAEIGDEVEVDGELTYDSAKVLFKNILHLGADDVFYYLGNGVGRVVLQAYLETPVRKSVGIEILPTRFEAAESARTHVAELLTQAPYAELWQRTWKEQDKTVEFRLENIANASITDATKIFMCTTGFPPELMDAVALLCKQLPHGVRVASLGKLGACSELTLVQTHKLPMSWSNNVNVYEYVVGPAPRKDASKKVKK